MVDLRQCGGRASGDEIPAPPLRPRLGAAKFKAMTAPVRRSGLREYLYFSALNAGLVFVLMLMIWSAFGVIWQHTGTVFAAVLAASPPP